MGKEEYHFGSTRTKVVWKEGQLNRTSCPLLVEPTIYKHKPRHGTVRQDQTRQTRTRRGSPAKTQDGRAEGREKEKIVKRSPKHPTQRRVGRRGISSGSKDSREGEERERDLARERTSPDKAEPEGEEGKAAETREVSRDEERLWEKCASEQVQARSQEIVTQE